jgi:hypothetical protein
VLRAGVDALDYWISVALDFFDFVIREPSIAGPKHPSDVGFRDELNECSPSSMTLKTSVDLGSC